MKKCMETDEKAKYEPLVNIVMATYNPKMDWLEEQLISLNQQSYKNIKLIVIDDFSTEVEFSDIKECVEKNITNFQYDIYQNKENLGSNKTFEKLTEIAEGEYIAYCDQDDVWLAEKIEKQISFINKTDSTLVCSDVYVIDTNGKIKASSITKIRKRHIFKNGKNLADDLLFKNFVIGCTMLISSDIAKESIPFIEDMVHDHYLALYASTKGSIGVYKENLTKYRIHENNQTNVLSGVKTKKDYYDVRIKPYLRRIEQIVDRLDVPKAKEAYEWAMARDGYYHKRENCAYLIWNFRHLNFTTTVFEIIMLKMPNAVFKIALNFIQRGII